MVVQRIWMLGMLLSMGICDAGPSRGYLPVAGPTILRFQLVSGLMSAGDLGPLAMKTLVPVDRGVAGREEEPMELEVEASTEVESGAGVDSPRIFGGERPARAMNPYDNGITSPADGGWWHLLVTNKAGMMSVPVPSVGFTPPAVVAPSSRAEYRTTP